jgi:DNA-binding NtrC family response regulator
MTHPSASIRLGHFLVAEPEPLFRLLLCVAFSGEFSDFSAVASFSEAEELLREHRFTAIVAEYHLPGGTGLSLYHEARRLMPIVPFVLMCGGLPVSVSDPNYRFFGKPFSVANLAETLRRMVAENPPVELPSGDPSCEAVR